MMYKRIKELRINNKLSQKNVAQILNCSQVVHSMYERGLRKIHTKIIIELAKFYNVSANYILELPKLPYPED